MAGDWIKMRTDLYRDPKVCVIADWLLYADGELARYVNQHRQRDMTVTRNVMRNVTVGALVSVWGVMRTRGKPEELDLVCRGVTLSVLDDIADLPGFGSALASVGWVEEREEGIVFPRFFEEHNVDPVASSKKKAADRQARYRERQKAKDDVIGDVTRDVTVTHREEKRREEKKEGECAAVAPPSTRKSKSAKTGMPDGFEVSERVRGWAVEKGYGQLDEHLEAFKRKVTAKGYTYASWDDAFMEAVREDWAKLRGRTVNGVAPPARVRGLVL